MANELGKECQEGRDDPDRLARERAERRTMAATWLLVLTLAALVARVVVAREGNLAWDDADYLRQGLRIANLAGAKGPLGVLPEAVTRVLLVRPKPPLLAAWVAAGRLVLGPRSMLALIVFSSAVPFGLLLGAVAEVARRLGGARAACWAVLAAAASPLALALGAKVMVETFMGLWVLLAAYAAARLLERPRLGRAVALGLALAGALLTKLTVALLLPVPAALFLVGFARRDGWSGPARRLALGVMLPLGLLAGPWYLRNGRAAVKFAAYSSRFQVLALGLTSSVPKWARIQALGRDVVGPATMGVAALAFVITVLRARRGGVPPSGVGPSAPFRSFARLAISSAASGTVILLIPSYFESRFLLPIWPALAVCLGCWLDRLAGARRRLGGLAVSAALAGCAVSSFQALGAELRNRTFWDTRALIDDLVGRYGVATIGNLGNWYHWNVSKTGLSNELRAGAGRCFVLRELSNCPPEELRRLIPRLDAIVALDGDRLPPSWTVGVEGLNRQYAPNFALLKAHPDLVRVGPDPTADLPPLAIFVRRAVAERWIASRDSDRPLAEGHRSRSRTAEDARGGPSALGRSEAVARSRSGRQ